MSVTIMSRSPQGAPQGVSVIRDNRDHFLHCDESTIDYDYVIDMIAYRENDAAAAIRKFPNSEYFLISTLWIAQKAGAQSGAVPPDSCLEFPESLPAATRKYLHGKLRCESEVVDAQSRNIRAQIVRLPILCGAQDHTGRSLFYLARALDGHGQILVDGGRNRVQVISISDFACTFTDLLESGTRGKGPIMEAVPPEAWTVSDIAQTAASVTNQEFRPHDITARALAQTVPKYLALEPLWNEKAVAPTEGNIFSLAGRTPASITMFHEKLFADIGKDLLMKDNRCRGELEAIRRSSG